MARPDIAVRRMFGHRLWGPPLESLEDVVRWLGALQAQEYPVAKWSVAQRTREVDDARMEGAFAEGAILRTHILRPTWHFVLPSDIRWIVSLTAPRVNALNAYYYRKLDLDEKIFAKCNALITKSLSGGGRLTRKEIATVLDRAGIRATGVRLAYIMMRAELDAVVCSGAPRGKQHTYALLDERAPQARVLGRDEALAELTKRYFTARGPATLKDYMGWSSLTGAEAKAGIEMVSSDLEHEAIDGRTYWFAPAPRNAKRSIPVVDLVQGYDECIMSYSESKDVLRIDLPVAKTRPAVPPYTHAILLDGQVIGHWKRVLGRTSIGIEPFFYRPLERIERQALDNALGAYERFAGAPVSLIE